MYQPGFSSGPNGNRVFIQRVPLLIVWISNLYDFVDGLTWHRFCDSKLRVWLYKMEDKYSDRFYIEADIEDARRFYEFMQWDYDAYLFYNKEDDLG